MLCLALLSIEPTGTYPSTSTMSTALAMSLLCPTAFIMGSECTTADTGRMLLSSVKVQPQSMVLYGNLLNCIMLMMATCMEYSKACNCEPYNIMTLWLDLLLFIGVLFDIAEDNHEVTCADAGGNVSHADCMFI